MRDGVWPGGPCPEGNSWARAEGREKTSRVCGCPGDSACSGEVARHIDRTSFFKILFI